jgi:signal transduction histidine kinase
VSSRRAAALALGAGGVGLAIAAVSAGRSHPGWWFAGESSTALALELTAGVSLVGAGMAAWLRRPASRFGPLLALAGIAWFLPEWDNPDIGASFAFSAGTALLAACAPLVAHAALAYPGGILRSRTERALVALAYVVSVLLLGLAPALLSDPAASGCADCPRNLLLVKADASLAESLQRLGLVLTPVWVGLVLALAAWRMARGSVARRRVVVPVLLPTAIYLTAFAADAVHSAGRGFLSNDPTDRALWVVQAVALCGLALGATWEWVRERRTRSALASLVVELERSPGPGGLRAAIAHRLGDPSLELHYGAVEARPGRQLTPLVSGGRRLAVVAHQPGLFDDPALAPQVASAAGLALDNERLQAELGAQLESLQASRARIVEASDAERRRLERDLHDSAQQRLVALSLSLFMTQQTHPDAQAERAVGVLRELLASLRELAHGLYPVVLADEGLAAALEALVEEPDTHLRFEGPIPDERFDPRLEAAAYLLVREVARDGGAIRLAREDGALVIGASANQVDPDELVHLEDRVGAVGGTLHVEHRSANRTRLRAELPCA